jgi:hypothetical protein
LELIVENMDDREKLALRKVHVFLVRGILNPMKVSLALKNNFIFSEYCIQKLSALPTQLQQASELLCMLTTKGPDAFSVFLGIMWREYPELANQILMTYYQVIMSHNYFMCIY